MDGAVKSNHKPVIPDEAYGVGDTFLILSVLPPELADTAFGALQEEVKWNTMAHRGGEVPRLISVQGDIAADGSIPLYRHPADEPPSLVPYTPTAARIRDLVERELREAGILTANGTAESDGAVSETPILNHALIQLYRNGTDYISEHADKTIDIVRNTPIISVSLGAQRTMTLRPKKGFTRADEGEDMDEDESSSPPVSRKGKRPLQRITLPHNSALVLGAHTNRGCLHAIRADRRPPALLPPEAAAAGGARASLTFRAIGTFLSPVNAIPNCDNTVEPSETDEKSDGHVDKKWLIWGQGAVGKTRSAARPVARGGSEADSLLAAFGAENRDPEFDWEKAYGSGFDVVNFN